MKKAPLVALLTLLVVLIPSLAQPEEGAPLRLHGPIYIDGNEGFTPKKGVVSGSGTKSDPYIIKNWKIRGNSFGIKVVNTNKYFILANCYIYRTSGDGIHLDRTAHGSIIECKIEEVEGDGIYIKNSLNTVIAHNKTFGNFGSGISLHCSDNNRIAYNSALRNSNEGIEISDDSDYNKVLGNLIESNGSRGFFGTVVAYGSCNNEILANDLSHNRKGGIHLHDLTEERCNNLVSHNNFWGHTSNKDKYGSQWDNGSEGNYWSGHLGWDGNGDGISDVPYHIEGGGTDRYPLMRPWKPSVVAMGIKSSGRDEFVTVRNWGEKDVDLTGWQLQSVDLETKKVRHAFSFPDSCILPADGKLKVHSGPEAVGQKNDPCGSSETDIRQGWRDMEDGAYVWNDLGGIVRLVNDKGEIVDEYEYHWWMGG